MANYRKGANAERELIHAIWQAGFAVSRVAGSGSSSLPSPDIIALKGLKRLAFECKAWDAAYLSLEIEKMEAQIEWCERAQAECWIGWKIPRQGWLFLKPEHFSKAGKNYMISKTFAQTKGIKLPVVLGHQTTLKES